MMKKILLGTTLLMGVAVSAAQAGEPLNFRINGFYNGAVGLTADGKYKEGDGRHNINFKQNVEVHFGGEVKLDNGIAVGGRVELEGQTHSDQIDATYFYFKTGLGEVRFGNFGSAAGLLCGGLQTASVAFPIAGAMSFSNMRATEGAGDQLYFSSDSDVCNTISDKSTRIAYFSPSILGFRVATSYMPDGAEDQLSNGRASIGLGGTSKDDDEQDSKEWSLAAEYSANIGSFGITAYAGWERSFESENNRKRSTMYQFGGGVTLGNLGVNVGYQQGFNLGRYDLDSKAFGLSGTYRMDAFTFGFAWIRSWLNDVSTTKNDRLDQYHITVGYALGTGVTLDALIMRDVYDSKNGATDDYKATVFAVGFSAAF